MESRAVRSLLLVLASIAAVASANAETWTRTGEATGSVMLTTASPTASRTFTVVVPDAWTNPLVSARIVVTPRFAAGATSGDVVHFVLTRGGTPVRDLIVLGSSPHAIEALVSFVGCDAACDRSFVLEMTRESTDTTPVDVTVDYDVVATVVGGGHAPPTNESPSVTDQPSAP